MKIQLLWLSLSVSLLASHHLCASEQINISNIPVELKLDQKSALSIPLALKQQLNLNDNYQLKLISTNLDKNQNLHQRFQQYYKNIIIWNQQVLTHQNKNNQKTYLSGFYLSQLEKDIASIIPVKSKELVFNLAQQKLSQIYPNNKQVEHRNTDLIIYFDSISNSAKLAYYHELYADSSNTAPIRQGFIIDANNGEIYRTWNALNQIEVTGPGGNQKTGQYLFGTDYPALIGSQQSETVCKLENANVRAVNLNHAPSNSDNTPFEFGCAENTFQPINGAFSPINDAFFFANLSFEMYQNWFNEAVLPQQLSVKVHYGNNTPLAFWDGQAVTFGDGDNHFYPLVDINMSVHEISHGFTELNSGLINQHESGAINESFSDIAGEVAEFYWKGQVDWAVSADILKNTDGLRFFADPTQDELSIDHFDDYFEGLDIHYASGIFNHAFYLLSNTPNWDPRKAFEVFLLANKSYWLADTNFATAACGLIMASFDLEYEWLDVYKSLSNVGVQCLGNAIDLDNDGMSDITEMLYGFDPTSELDAEADFDADGLSNLVEISSGFNPKDRDTDNDGLDDGEELNQYATSVINPDTDNDGMSDGWEVTYGFDPLINADAKSDKDGDSYNNLQEFIDQTNPNDPTSFKPRKVQRDGIYDLEDAQTIPNTSILVTADANFIPLSTPTSLGSYSLVNEDIGDLQTAAMVWNLNLIESGQMSFDLKVSSEEHRDFFKLIIDSTIIFTLAGEHDWQNFSFPLSAGNHNIIFSYQKNESLSIGDDSVWLDNLSFTGLLFDQDGDAMSDSWESFYGLDPTRAHDSTGDLDEDGLTNLEEYNLFTAPTLADSDTDLLSDFDEINIYHTDPNNADSDFDGINDGLEISLSLNPLNAADGLLDLDQDGINNQTEAKYQTALDDPQDYPQLLTYQINNFNDPLSEHWDLTNADSWSIESTDNADPASNKLLFAEPIGNNNQAKISYLDVFDTGTLTFTINTDTELNDDLLQIYLDEQLIKTTSGQTNEMVSIELTRGEHKISWVYNKNFALSSVIDRISIDDILFIAPNADTDNDGLTNAEELALGTDLNIADTDGDGLTDGKEIEMGTDPKLEDTDRDGYSDLQDAYPLDSTRWDQSGRWNDTGGGGSLFTLLPFFFLSLLRKKQAIRVNNLNSR